MNPEIQAPIRIAETISRIARFFISALEREPASLMRHAPHAMSRMTPIAT
jgi:hypothetical protein